MRTQIEQEQKQSSYSLATYATSAALVVTIGYIVFQKFNSTNESKQPTIATIIKERAPPPQHKVVSLQDNLLETLG